jgi:hypothetical protein
MSILPTGLRRLTPNRLRDDVRLRALAVGTGLIPPRTMHSAEDASVLLDAARGARRVVEIGVYEGSSAVVLCEALSPDTELHLVDPFGRHPDALPSGWGATEWATRRVVSRALRRRGSEAPAVHWHVCLSAELAARWHERADRGTPDENGVDVDLVFIDGDHSESGCELDWSEWHRFVALGGHVVFHDARADRPDGRGLPGPTVVVARHFRSGGGTPGWEIAAEADRTVAVRRTG